MRLSSLFITAGAFLGAAALCLVAAYFSARMIAISQSLAL